MGIIFAFLRVSSSVQVRGVARQTMASAGKRKITWSCTKYVAVISAHRFSIWQKGSGYNIETCQFDISYLKAWSVHYLFDTSHMKNQYPTFSMDAVRGADLTQRHNAGLETNYWLISSHRETYQSMDCSWQNTCQTGKDSVYNHV